MVISQFFGQSRTYKLQQCPIFVQIVHKEEKHVLFYAPRHVFRADRSFND